MRLAILALALLPSLARAADLAPEDYQAALAEANSQIAGLSNRAQQLAVQVAQQGRELAQLKAKIALSASIDAAKAEAGKAATKPPESVPSPVLTPTPDAKTP